MATLALDELKQRQRLEWQAAAPGWRKWDRLIMRGLQPVSDLLIRNAGIIDGYSVLDMATGTGEPALTIAKIVGRRGRVVGADLSPDMLQVARERMISQTLENVTFQVAEDEDLPTFQDNSFDAAVCRFGLMFMPNPVAVLRAIRRTLKPGRKVSVSVWGPPERAPFFTTAMKVVSKHFPDIKPPPPGTPGGPFAIPSPRMLEDIFTKAGFLGFDSETAEVEVVQTDSPEEYWQASTEMSGQAVFLFSKIPSEKRDALRKDVIEILRSQFPTGKIRLTGEVIVGTGAKT